jgi:hypothetical protein
VAVVTAGPSVVDSFPDVAVAHQTREPVVVIGDCATIARREEPQQAILRNRPKL